jgi:hypothetical protein
MTMGPYPPDGSTPILRALDQVVADRQDRASDTQHQADGCHPSSSKHTAADIDSA